ncbi:MAG TPA: hypothetical protein VG297_01250 [Bryobacteraceae bacterium]|nr:hypothetical protein [Bryobacteraceae bacterium]
MPRFLKYLADCYRLSLRLYPGGLRASYGDEMASDFEQLIHDEYARRGARGVARASLRAFREFFTVALPRHLVSDWLIAASLSVVITSGILGSLVGIMTARVLVTPGAAGTKIHRCR